MGRLLTVTLLVTIPLGAAVFKKKVAKPAPSGLASKGKSSKRRVATSARGPKTPVAPSSDRYKEIQDALIAKGYLKTPSTGVWDQESQEAMRKFQADQNLDPTGKLTSRSLISLGLGPQP